MGFQTKQRLFPLLKTILHSFPPLDSSYCGIYFERIETHRVYLQGVQKVPLYIFNILTYQYYTSTKPTRMVLCWRKMIIPHLKKIEDNFDS